MQDRPDARELIQAVTGFVERELIPALADPRLRFRALVAANVLAIVNRELEFGEEQLKAEQERLVALLGKAPAARPDNLSELRDRVLDLNRELCARIRSGAADTPPFRDLVFAHTESTVIEKLRVANPRYLDRVTRETSTE